MQITMLEGRELAEIVRVLNAASKAGKLHALRIHQGPSGVIYKVNGGCWSPPVGRDGSS